MLEPRVYLSMGYRDEQRALQDRRDQLMNRLREARVAEATAREARVEAASDARASATTGHRLPMLEDIRIASPCKASWDKMRGDERTRFCGDCKKSVHNLSAMTREEATAFIATRDAAMCVRLFMRADGTVLTSDCPAQRKQRIAAAAWSGAAAALLSFAGWLGFARTSSVAPRSLVGEAVMGDLAIEEPHAVSPNGRQVLGEAPPPRGRFECAPGDPLCDVKGQAKE